jgi:hypothetical protein
VSEAGDQVEGNVGDNADSVAVGKNIKLEKTTATGNVLTVNVPGWSPSVAHGQDAGRIPLEVEREFRARFDKIGEKLEANTLAVAKLEGTLDKSNILVQTQIDTLKANQKSLEELARGTDEKIVQTLAGLHLVAAPAPSPDPVQPEPPWMPTVRLVIQALTAAAALGLLAYFVMGG